MLHLCYKDHAVNALKEMIDVSCRRHARKILHLTHVGGCVTTSRLLRRDQESAEFKPLSGNHKISAFVPAECTNAFRVNITISSDYLPKQH
jgi:hypothetical protein